MKGLCQVRVSIVYVNSVGQRAKGTFVQKSVNSPTGVEHRDGVTARQEVKLEKELRCSNSSGEEWEEF